MQVLAGRREALSGGEDNNGQLVHIQTSDKSGLGRRQAIVCLYWQSY